VTDFVSIQAATLRSTSEAWATLVAAFIGALTALVVVWIQRVLDKRDRDRDAERRRRALASAVLLEIDDHYRACVRDLLDVFEKQSEESPPIAIKSMTNVLPVYAGNVGAIGDLPFSLVEATVHYYGVLQAYIGTLSQYVQGYELMLKGDPTLGKAIMRSLETRIKREARAISQLAYTTCGLLCSFVGIDFSFPRIGVAGYRDVYDGTRSTLDAARKQLAAELRR
jgi:hypothetical protein